MIMSNRVVSTASLYAFIFLVNSSLFLTLLFLPLMTSASTGEPCLVAPSKPSTFGHVVNVENEGQLQAAIGNLSDDITLVLAPGIYELSHSLYIKRNNVTILGGTGNCDDVVLVGNGMNNADYGDVPHGVWVNSIGFKIAHLTIRDVYQHTIIFNGGAESPQVYNVKLLNSGQQFIKSNPIEFGDGVDNGRVEYTIMEYTAAPTNHTNNSGYTNGVDVHAGKGWVIRNSLFKNFHTPDTARFLWNPAILMWNGASGTVAEGNIFIDVDRAIAYGLDDKPGNDHFGGIIRNNMIYYSPGLYSDFRRNNSDAAILVWDSPQSKVFHNTILTNGNLNDAVQLRFSHAGVEVKNNLMDRPVRSRDGVGFVSAGNFLQAVPEMFVAPASGRLHLKDSALEVIDKVTQLSEVIVDFDGQSRPALVSDIGADELLPGGDFSIGTF